MYYQRAAEREARRREWAIQYEKARRMEEYKRRERERLFGMWDWGHPRCLCHGALDCKDRVCRTVAKFTHNTRSGPRSDKHGSFFALWAILYYLRAMIDGKGPSVEEFGKRFAHRRTTSETDTEHKR